MFPQRQSKRNICETNLKNDHAYGRASCEIHDDWINILDALHHIPRAMLHQHAHLSVPQRFRILTSNSSWSFCTAFVSPIVFPYPFRGFKLLGLGMESRRRLVRVAIFFRQRSTKSAWARSSSISDSIPLNFSNSSSWPASSLACSGFSFVLVLFSVLVFFTVKPKLWLLVWFS